MIKTREPEKPQRRQMKNGRVLPANPAFAKTEFTPTAPQSFTWLVGAHSWS